MQITKHVEFHLNPVWEPVFQFFLFVFHVFYKKKTAYILRLHHWFPGKWLLRNGRWNCILITRHYPDLGSDASSVWNSCVCFSVVASRNVGCFLRLVLLLFCIIRYFWKTSLFERTVNISNIRRTWGRNRNKTGNLYSLCLVFYRFSRVTHLNVVFKKLIKPFLAFLPKLFP